jgi:uncharacterized membrane protein
MESRTRSLLKAISWRVTATVTTIIIAYFITGQVDAALAIGSIEFVLKFVIYYAHERAWLKVRVGQHPSLDEQQALHSAPNSPRHQGK